MESRKEIIIEKIKNRRMRRAQVLDTIFNGNNHYLSQKYFCYHKLLVSLVSIAIIINIISMLTYVLHPTSNLYTVLIFTSIVSSIIFLIEFGLRLIAAPATYPSKNILKAQQSYLFSYMGILDSLSVLSFIIPILIFNDAEIFYEGNEYLIAISLTSLNLKMVRYFKTFQFILRVFSSVKKELALGFITAGVIVICSGSLMYYVECEAQPEKFKSISDGFWWAVITFATVGYGDIYPITTLGKILASLISFIGIGTVTIPSCIISGAFIKAMQDKEHKKDYSSTSSSPKTTKASFCGYCGNKVKLTKEKPFCIYCGKKYNNE